MSYARGRRFEHLVKDKLVAAGFDARRVPLSGRQRPEGEFDIPNTDIIVENKFFCKAKTTKAKKYVSFPEGEIMELAKGVQDFLVFNFNRTPPFVVVRFEDFLDLLKMWKEKGRNEKKD
jgi:Holliday junction resolvase